MKLTRQQSRSGHRRRWATPTSIVHQRGTPISNLSTREQWSQSSCHKWRKQRGWCYWSWWWHNQRPPPILLSTKHLAMHQIFVQRKHKSDKPCKSKDQWPMTNATKGHTMYHFWDHTAILLHKLAQQGEQILIGTHTFGAIGWCSPNLWPYFLKPDERWVKHTMGKNEATHLIIGV